MSLLGLLSIGRSFGTVRERPASFRVADGWLPDFGRRREHELAEFNGSEEVLTGACWPERELGEPGPGAARVAPPPNPVKASPSRASRLAGRPRSSGGVAVQGELALGTVRVVRNELDADDLELIPLPSKTLAANFKTTVRERPTGGGWRGWWAHWRQWFRGSTG
ncbi:MAG: hypothetical protein M5U12_28245 [Verrucomicrobia bacterium]|nr:hypothetical protein [Verrucomicrobiota bacterium]